VAKVVRAAVAVRQVLAVEVLVELLRGVRSMRIGLKAVGATKVAGMMIIIMMITTMVIAMERVITMILAHGLFLQRLALV
jgi:hypothetical protein